MILATLALRAGQVASYDELGEVIWDGAPPSGARVAIRNYVKRLRQVLGPVAGRRIITRDPGYALEADLAEVDALQFTALCAQGGEAARQGDASLGATWDMLGEALHLWRGNPLSDVPSNALITAEVPRLEALRMQAQEWRMDAGLALGRHAELVAELSQLAHDHPWRERFHAQLMLALYRCGRQAEALAAYQRTRRMLVDELGVEPGRELRDLHVGILAGDPALAAPGVAAGSGDGSAAARPPLTGPRRAAAAPAGSAGAGDQRGARRGGAATVRDAAATRAGQARIRAAGPDADSSAPAGVATGRQRAPEAAPGGGPPAGPGTPRLETAVVPRQLPAGVAHFTGRSAELAELNRWRQDAAVSRSVKILVIGGMAGAGKTALAVHWAHRVAGEFPDGQLYVNLRGFGPSGRPVPPVEALRWFLGAFGMTEEQIPDSVDAQAALYRSVLADKRVLVILDNARDAAQVRPLLPGSSSCLVLVTSRARLPGLAATEGAALVQLDVLSAEEAHELLAGRLGSRAAEEPEAASALIESCSRLPLALSIVAARAAARPLWPLAALARELADAQGRLDALDAGDPVASVRAVFSWSCQQLPGPAVRLFRLLGLHPGPDFSIAAAASLAGLAPARVAAMMAELADAHLIAEHAPGRYVFHDLLRAYAADLARTTDSDADRRAAVGRLLDHYLHTAYSGSLAFNPNRAYVTLAPPAPGVAAEVLATVGEAMTWARAERQVLLAVIALADQGGFDTYAWQLPWAAWLLFDRAGFWHDQVVIQRTALEAARRLGDLTGQAHACRDLGAAYGRLGLLAEAWDCCRQALQLHRQAGDRLGQARAHNELMLLADAQGQAAQALGHARLSLDLYREEGDEPGQARMLNAVGWMHAKLGDYEQALGYCQQALGMYQGHGDYGDPVNHAATWDSVGYVLFHLGRLEEAIGCLQTALRIIGPGYYQTTMLVHLGDAYHASGQPAPARDAWQTALTILEELNHADAEQVRNRLLGEVPPKPGSIPAADAASLGGRPRAGQAVGA